MPAGPKVFESFGMTETISHFALRQLVPIQETAFQCLEGFEVVQAEDSVLEIVFPNGKHLKTNDAVKVTEANAFEWLGRRDDVINSGGIKIHPAQIERALASLIPGPFKVYGEYHATWGTQLVLRVHATAPPSNASQLEAEWTAWAKRHLPLHHSPKRIEWKELKQTGSGKWLRP
jgi:O-succinylbenzoic acid--CoA ligase